MRPRIDLTSTYRLQFNQSFTFRDASQLAGYLSELGISHVYASPIFRSHSGSTHGYDVTDPTRINPELGSEADFYSFRDELEKHGVGLVLDIVPNHMSASSENSWWMDVLENGPGSPYASYFDIDWHPPSKSLEGRILLPVLGRPFGETLEQGEFSLVFQEGRFYVQYFDSLFPLAPGTYRRILSSTAETLKSTLGEESLAFQEYSGIAASASAIAESNATNPEAVTARRLLFEGLRERLRQLVTGNPEVRSFLDTILDDFKGQKENPSSFSPLERLLDEQFYVLAYWQNVNEEINYRRFFTISDLVGVRMQDPRVFDATHALVLRLVEQGSVDGLRIDHIDGLRDPLAYLTRLREHLAALPGGSEPTRIPIFVEKILARTERLPREWPVEGTTGYDFVNALNAFFVYPPEASAMERIYAGFLGKEPAYDDVLYQKKRLVMATLLGVEMRSAGHALGLLASKDRYARDIPRSDLELALVETTAFLRVYRTYIRNLEPSAQDKDLIETALADARARRPQLNAASFDFVGDVLLLRNPPHVVPEQREARLAFVMRWQQFTGPIMAKAFEDTFLYVYNPLVSLNEVGGDPRPTSAATTDFTAFARERSEEWPHSLNATTTHDTKRSEDVRARINVLSEVPDEWELRLKRWAELNAMRRRVLQGQPVPDRNEEIFLYETLLGMWPGEEQETSEVIERLQAYAIKATREAMVHTRWTLPNLPHEEALKEFIASILTFGTQNKFRRDFLEFERRIAYYGMLNALSQTLLKIVSPGTPDIYQGSELWDLRLVDPDNRQPVDFEKRRTMLEEIRAKEAEGKILPSEWLRNWRDGRIKLYLIWKALRFRKEHQELFGRGDFREIEVSGPRSGNVAAFARTFKTQSLVVAVPRWLAREAGTFDPENVGAFWDDTSISLPARTPGTWKNLFTSEEIQSEDSKDPCTLVVGKIFGRFPVALLSADA